MLTHNLGYTVKQTIQDKVYRSFILKRLFSKIIVDKLLTTEVKNPINMMGDFNRRVTYCFNCGKGVRNMKYCSNCGYRLKWGNRQK